MKKDRGVSVGCLIFIIAMIISAVGLTISHIQDNNKKEKVERERAEKIDSFFNKFDKYSRTPYLSTLDIMNIVNGEYNICSNIKSGAVFIIDTNCPLFKHDSIENQYTTILGVNKITLTIKHPNARATDKNKKYTLCYVESVSSKSYDGGCHVVFGDLLTFLDEDIINGSDKLYNIITGAK